MPTVEAVDLRGVSVLLEGCEIVGDVMAKIAAKHNRFATHIVVVDPTSGKELKADEDIQLAKVEFVILNEEDAASNIESCVVNLRLHAAQSDQSTCSKVFETLRGLTTKSAKHASHALCEVCKRRKGKWSEAVSTLARFPGVGNRALLAVSQDGDAEAVEFLLCARAEVNYKDKDDGTPLMKACVHGHAAIVQTLLSAKAEVDSEDCNELTALHLLSESDNVEGTEIVQMLLSAGAELERRDDYGRTPLAKFARAGRAEIVQLLLSVRAEVDSVDDQGDTALIHAIENPGIMNMPSRAPRNAKMVQILLSAGADVKCDDSFHTALMHASMSYDAGGAEIAQTLLSAQAEVDSKDEKGRTALMYASAVGHTAVVKVLLSAGANANNKTKNGHTALVYACGDHLDDMLSPYLSKPAKYKNKNKAEIVQMLSAGEDADCLGGVVQKKLKREL